MRGTPVLRLILVVLFLGGAGWLVARIAGPAPHPRAAAAPPSTPAAPPAGADLVVPAFVQVHLSAPAKRIVWAGTGEQAPVLFDVVPASLDLDLNCALALHEGLPTARTLTVDWADHTRSNFVHLRVEPETLATKETTLHFPANEPTVPVDLEWPEARN